ncbi:hypothetical protein LTR86_005335 [Recurvomyces mirabilis]|nr:hypothetical protein LTR86_005335 [Recurvomyces mirabilis]
MGRPPYTQWTETDHSGPVVITTILCLIYWTVPGLGQQIANFGHRSFFSWADGLYLASMLVGFIQSILVLVAASQGLGKAIRVLDISNASRALQLYHASNILYVVVLGLAKCSAICSIISLTVMNRGPIQQAPVTQKIVIGVVIAIAGAWTIGSVAALSS